jgi:hypothetical protein
MLKFIATVVFGAVVGTLLGAGLVLAGLVWNLWTIPAWTACGALIGLGHAVGHAAIEAFGRWAMKDREPGAQD